MTGEEPEARQENVLAQGREAKVLLEHPLIVKFLEDERAETVAAFDALTFNPQPEDYMPIQSYRIALNKFEQTLRGYVEGAKMYLIEEAGKTTEDKDTEQVNPEQAEKYLNGVNV